MSLEQNTSLKDGSLNLNPREHAYKPEFDYFTFPNGEVLKMKKAKNSLAPLLRLLLPTSPHKPLRLSQIEELCKTKYRSRLVEKDLRDQALNAIRKLKMQIEEKVGYTIFSPQTENEDLSYWLIEKDSSRKKYAKPQKYAIPIPDEGIFYTNDKKNMTIMKMSTQEGGCTGEQLQKEIDEIDAQDPIRGKIGLKTRARVQISNLNAGLKQRGLSSRVEISYLDPDGERDFNTAIITLSPPTSSPGTEFPKV